MILKDAVATGDKRLCTEVMCRGAEQIANALFQESRIQGVAGIGGAQGTELLARLIDGAAAVLRSGGLLAFETGRGPDEHAVRLLSEAGVYRDVTCYESAGQVCAMSAIRVRR